jgi:hypothetical protein
MALLSLFCLLGLAAQGVASATPARNILKSSAGINSNFALADFDGDRKPDLAIVEAEKNGSSARTRYSIRFELAAGDAQVFGLTAPAGGLQIMPRDVNGDDALDLLVSTTWQHTQVAVLLNDGHGNFRLAEPGAFLSAFWWSEKQWNSRTTLVRDGVALLPSPGSTRKFAKRNEFPGLLKVWGTCLVPTFSKRISLLLFPRHGRAPPAFVIQA